jgi:hypothetical protein
MVVRRPRETQNGIERRGILKRELRNEWEFRSEAVKPKSKNQTRRNAPEKKDKP